VLDRLRGRLNSALLGIGAGAARLLPSPTAWTILGVLFALLASYSYSLGGGLHAVLAGALVLVSGFLDVVDGAVARVTNRVSKRGAFLDSTLDRVGEVALYVGILLGAYAAPLWTLLALALSLLVSYARAKADSLGVGLAGIGVGERPERLIVLVAASLLGYVQYGILLVILLAGVTFLQRVYRVSGQLR
jgi:archaetidylinositol phosphate synthase